MLITLHRFETEWHQRYIILLFWEFFPPVLVDGFPLESEWQQISSSLQNSTEYSGWSHQCCSLDSLYSCSYFQVPQSLYQSLVTVPSMPISVGIIVIFRFHSFFSSLARSKYLSLFSLSFSFNLWSARMVKFTIQQYH